MTRGDQIWGGRILAWEYGRPLSPPNGPELPEGHFVCASCFEPRPDEKAGYSHGGSAVCEDCAKDRGMQPCAHCGTYGDPTDDVAELAAKPGAFLCQGCAVTQSLSFCEWCAKLTPSASSVLAEDGHQCAACRAEEERRVA